MAVLVTDARRPALILVVTRAALLFLSCAVALACGRRTVELSTPPHVAPSADPTIVGSINEQVGWLTVDGERLYWSGRYADFSPDSGGTGAALHSCSKNRCSETVVTYDASTLDTRSGFSVQGADIYWMQLRSWQNASSYQLVTCPVTGCDGAARVIYVSQMGDLRTVAFGPAAAYFSGFMDGTVISRIPFSGGADPQAVARSTDEIQSLAVNGEYLYSLGSSMTGIVNLRRARTDGSSPLEPIASNLKILFAAQEPNAALSPYVDLAFDDTYVYWTSNTLSGSIQRCPLSGCVNSPEILTPPTRAPTALHLDGAIAYFQYFDTQLGNSLSRCILENCQPSTPIVSGLDDGNGIAIDDQFVYAASSDDLPTPDSSWDFPSAQIRRFPK